MHRPTLRILGIRGLPAAHGGFETFAERLALHLVDQGWTVVVYCQDETGQALSEDAWRGVTRVHVPVKFTGSLGSVLFDWKAIRHAMQHSDLCLTLGYNTAVFCGLLRLAGVRNVINMDGIEWKRQKWGPLARAWFWANEWAGCRLGDHLIADHPEIAHHLQRHAPAHKITMIPYGADEIEALDPEPLAALGLEEGQYVSVIARPEPENSLLEIVRGFSIRKRGAKLAVLGNYDPANAFHRQVKAAASPEVLFLGAIYDRALVQCIRLHSIAYAHGHQVGGTNPSLVEALGAGNAVIAHDNAFNRWVAGPGAEYFTDAESFDSALAKVLGSPYVVERMRTASRSRFRLGLQWPAVLVEYERVLRAVGCTSTEVAA